MIAPLDSALTKNTGGGGTPTLPRRAALPPSYAPRDASIRCSLSRLRILPVTTGVYPPSALTRHSFIQSPWRRAAAPEPIPCLTPSKALHYRAHLLQRRREGK